MAKNDTPPVDPSAGSEIFEKVNDYTLSVIYDFNRMSGADPELRRIFNFMARQVTEIYNMRYSSSVTSSMQIKQFSELDSLDEVNELRAKLISMGGHPPDLPSDASIKRKEFKT